MSNNKLNIIDFSKGIRSEEIQENFDILQNEINRERISLGGTGISSGLEITPIITADKFAIKINEASIITNNGEEIFINEQVIDIEKPQLISQCEFVTANSSNQILLKEIPYGLNRLKPSQYLDTYIPSYSGITINYKNSTKEDDNIRIKSIDGYTLTLTGLIKRNLKVTYYYSAKRIDTVYIDNNNEIQVKASSITSTTPSAILPDSYKYLIAYILIDSSYQENKDDIPHANIIVKKDLRDLRNIYTDKNGELYLCGIPFNDLQFISLTEPKDPKENQLWLNTSNNTLYIYKKTYNYNYRKNIEITNGYTDDYGSHLDFVTDIPYNINLDKLDVYVNYNKLRDDEYTKLHNDVPVNLIQVSDNEHSDKFRVYKVLNNNDILTYNITLLESTYSWIPINKESYVNAKEVKIYGVDREWENDNYWSSLLAESLGTDNDGYKNKYKYFIFDLNKDKKLLYTPNKNELSIMINQVFLHKDQYEEITLYNAFDILPEAVIKAMQENYGYDRYSLGALNEEYDNFGIGFMLKDPLDALLLEGTYDNNNNIIHEEELYVEVHVNRAVSEAPSKRKLQRFATYIYEDSVIVSDTDKDKIVTISDNNYYRYNENQLEVFINGIKLARGIDFEEGTDLILENIKKDYRSTHAISKQFKILKSIHIGDVVSYRIVSNFLNYDHINSLLDKLDLDYNSCVSKVDTLYSEAVSLNEDTAFLISNVQKEINELKQNSSIDSDKYLTNNSVLSEENLPISIINNLVQSLDHISEVITYRSGSSDINVTSNNIRQKDYINIIHRDIINNKDTFLIRNVDYTLNDISINDSYSQTRLTLTNVSQMNDKDLLIITGIKFGKEGR